MRLAHATISASLPFPTSTSSSSFLATGHRRHSAYGLQYF